MKDEFGKGLFKRIRGKAGREYLISRLLKKEYRNLLPRYS